MKSKYRHPAMVMQKFSAGTDPDTRRYALMFDPTDTLDPRHYVVAGKQMKSDLKYDAYKDFTVFRLIGNGQTHRFIVFGKQLWRISHLPYNLEEKATGEIG